MATGGRLAVALVAGGLLAAACGSDGEESLAPLDPEPTTSEVEVSEADASETSVPSEDTTSSTELPEVTTPVDASGKPLIEIPTEWDSDLDEIFGRYQLYYDAFYIAAGPPSGPSLK